MKANISLSSHFTYRKLFYFTFPSIIMMVFTSIYGVVDGYFVSNFAGKTAFAAINLVIPFIMILGGMGFMIGAGGTALVSKTLGEGNREKANRYFSMMVYLTLILGIALSIAGFIFIRPVSVFLGATGRMINDCVLYGRIVLGFTTAFMLQNVFQSFLIAILVGIFRWGVAGAALATGLSQCVGGIFPLLYFIRPNSSLLRLTKTKLQLKPVLQACGNGSSELMSNISTSVVSIIYNFQLLKYIGEDGVSAYGVIMYVEFAFAAIFIGYSIGSAPIISYHYGAQNHAELKNMLKKSVLLTGSGGIILTGLAFVLANPLAKLFVGYDTDLFYLTSHAFCLFAFSFVLAGFNIFVSSFFTALNNGGISAAISFLRTLVFQTTFVLILPIFFGVDGIWIAITVAEVFACIISIICIFAKRKKYRYL